MGRRISKHTLEDLEDEICAASADEILDDLLTPIVRFCRKQGRNSSPVQFEQIKEEEREAQRSRKDNS